MGMAASQARYLGLTARKTNVEYEGQQINQARTALANQSANTFNDLLALEVPTAPQTQDYTEIIYSYEEGTEKETITGMARLENDPDGYNYLVTHYHYADVFTGVMNKLANPQVVMKDTGVETELSKDSINTVEQPTYTVNGYNTSNYDPTNPQQKDAFDRISADYTQLQEVPVSDIRCYTDNNNVLHFLTTDDLNGTSDVTDYYINRTSNEPTALKLPRTNVVTTKPEGDLTYTVNGQVVSTYDPTNLEQKQAFDSVLSDYPSLGKNVDDVRYYQDANGNYHFITQSALEGKAERLDYTVASEVPTQVGNLKLTKYNANDAEQKAALEQIIADWPNSGISLADPNDIYVWEYQGQTRFATRADLANTALSGPDPTRPTENQDKLTYYVAQNISTKIERSEKAMVDLDEKGRPQSVRFEDSSANYALATETVTDEVAYEDAMNQYNYNMEVYQKKIEDINAKTKKIQEQDRTLELRLRQLDTEQEALQTEMEAVKKVIDKNIESTFKTFE